jgi:c-di-GMP-binding flagellar brake protein YcgR
MPKSKKKAEALVQPRVPEDFAERRRTARLDIPINVRYRVTSSEDERVAVTKNISFGGCLLLATEPLPIGSVVELSVMLGDSEAEALLLKGNIVRLNRSEKGLYEFGIAFTGMSGQARRLFADFCFAKMYEMIGLPEWPTDRRQKD